MQPLRFVALLYTYRLNFNNVLLVNKIGKVSYLKMCKVWWFWIIVPCITSTCSCSWILKSSIQIKIPGVICKKCYLFNDSAVVWWCKRIQSNTGSHTVKPLLNFSCWILEAVLHGLACELWNLSDLAPSQIFSTPNLFPQLNQTLMLKKYYCVLFENVLGFYSLKLWDCVG